MYLATSVLGEQALTDHQAATIYALRWGLELFYRHFKQTYERRKLRSYNAGHAELEATWSLLGLWAMDNVTAESTDGIVRHLSLLAHYANFNRGVIDSFDLAYFAIFIVIFLLLSIRRLDSERLHG